MSDQRATEMGKDPLATVIAHAEVAVEAQNFPQTPGIVINKILDKAGKTKEDIDLLEISEAFAVASLARMKSAGLDPETFSVNGGAVALGYPSGARGARILPTLIHEL